MYSGTDKWKNRFYSKAIRITPRYELTAFAQRFRQVWDLGGGYIPMIVQEVVNGRTEDNSVRGEPY